VLLWLRPLREFGAGSVHRLAGVCSKSLQNTRSAAGCRTGGSTRCVCRCAAKRILNLRERIDEGGFGAVYRCEQPALDRDVVVKVLHRRMRRPDPELLRFMREAKLAARIDHPYAAHVYDVGRGDDGLLWIAMECVQGITLSHWLRDRGPMSLDQFMPFFERVAEVVQAAHERGIVHRDLKPSNMMVIERTEKLLPKLLYFGVAKLLGELPDPSPVTIAAHRRRPDRVPSGSIRP